MTPEHIILGVFAATIVGLAIYNCRTLTLPDSVTLPGIVAGLIVAGLFPVLHGETKVAASLMAAFKGLMLGAFLVYCLLRIGKAQFGKRVIGLLPSSKIILTQTSLVMPGNEMLYQDVFYRKSDRISFVAWSVELTFVDADCPNQSFENVLVTLGPDELRIGESVFDPEQVVRIEALTDGVTVPREALGFGVVKLVAFIGTFLGWQAVLFVLGCWAIALGLASVVFLTVCRMHKQANIEAATPLCVASIVWIFFPTQIALAGGLAIALGTCISIAVTRWRLRIT